MITMRELASRIAEFEGKKSEASIGDIREILKLVSIMMAMDAEVVAVLIKNGLKYLED